jgi:hypothetical protein
MSVSILQNAQSSGAMSLLNSSTNSHLVNAAANTGKAAEQAASHELKRTKGSEKAAASSAVQLKYEFATQAKNKSAETESDEAYYLTLSEEALEQYHKSEPE